MGSLRRPITDGLVTIRPPAPGDAARLVAGRQGDEAFARFLGAGAGDDPDPTAVIVVDDAVVGWVDHDLDRTWLEPGEINVGYHLFASVRGHGYATRAVHLLLHHLAVDTDHRVATLLIDPANERSLALAARIGSPPPDDLDGNPYFKRPIPPLTYSDGVVTIRRLDPDPDPDRAQAFGAGPKWAFAVDTVDTPYVADVDVDLANEHVPHGEANVSYSAHPDHRGRGHASRAVRLALRFLADHTGAREAHFIADAGNMASVRAALAVGGRPVESWTDVEGRPMVRHVVPVRDAP